MRDKEAGKLYMQKYRFQKTLEQWKREQKRCTYCEKILETIHHKDENQANNRITNYIPVCKEHHLEIPHNCDSEFERASVKPEVPQIRNYRTKVCKQILENCNTGRICNITIYNPITKSNIFCSEVSRHCFEFLVNLGFTEVRMR